MIKNCCRGLLVATLVAGCQAGAIDPGAYLQGVVEYDSRAVAFEVGGRIAKVVVHRGDRLAAGGLVATLDDELAKTERAARAAEARAAAAKVALLQAGSRPETIESMKAEVRAAAATEAELDKSAARQHRLFAQGASTQARVDDIDARLAAAHARRRSLQHKLAELRQGARSQEIAAARAQADAAAKAVELADERIARHRLVAPMAGIVLDVDAKAGEVVAPGAPVITLADTTRPYVDLFVPIGELGGVRVGAAATVRVDATRHVFRGRVGWISPTTEYTPHYLFSNRERPNLVVRVRVYVADPKRELHAGVPAFATIDRHPRGAR